MLDFEFAHWRDGAFFLGYLLDYPDYWTQGTSLEDLIEHLVSLREDIESGTIPGLP